MARPHNDGLPIAPGFQSTIFSSSADRWAAAVAVDLASEYGAKGLILQNTFTSLPDVAATIYWFVPVRLLMRSRLDSESKIANYSGPLILCHGTNDRVVPYELGQRLFDAANEPKILVTDEGGGHETGFPQEYYDQLEKFINEQL